MSTQHHHQNNQDDGLMTIAALAFIAIILWLVLQTNVVYGLSYALFKLYDILPFSSQFIEGKKTLLYTAAMNRDHMGFFDFLSVLDHTALILLPIFLIIAGILFFLVIKSPFYRLTRKITISTLPWILVKKAPANAHVLSRFGKFKSLLLNENPDEAKSPLSPEEFAQEHQLVDENKNMRKRKAHRVFYSQVDINEDGELLKHPWEKVLAASFAYVRFTSDRAKSKKLLDALNLSCLNSKNGFPSFDQEICKIAWSDIEKNEEFQKLMSIHTSSRALLYALLDDDLHIPPAQFRWLKGIDRTLWMALSSVGRGKFFVEGAGVIAWSQCETYCNKTKAGLEPTVRAAVIGLEQELIRNGIVIQRVSTIQEVDLENDSVTSPFNTIEDDDIGDYETANNQTSQQKIKEDLSSETPNYLEL